MTHDEAYALLPSLVGLRATGPADAALLAHVAGCPDCAARLRHLERIADTLGDARETHGHPLDALEARVLAIPAAEPRRPVSRVRRRLMPMGVGIAAAASIAALALVLLRPEPAPVPAPDRFVAQRTVALQPVAENVQATVTLGRPSGAMRVVRLDVRGLPMDGPRSFDLWFITASGAVRVGSFGPGKDGNCIVDLTTSAQERWTRMAITPSGMGPEDAVLARTTARS